VDVTRYDAVVAEEQGLKLMAWFEELKYFLY
jgi:hypothetical protein